MLSTNDFKTIALEDRPVFKKHYEKYPNNHSDNLFTTLISWMDFGKYEYVIIDDNLIVMSQIKDEIKFRSPSGKRSKEIFDQLLTLAQKQKSIYPLTFIDTQTKGWLSENYPKLILTSCREMFDYVYLASDLAQLPGTKYGKIRNRLNKFQKNYSYSVEKISEENMNEIREFLKRWCLWKDCESDVILENERKAILYSISNFFELELSGIVIYINGKIEAISVYERLNSDTAVVHYEKGSPDYDGIYKAINQETAKILEKDFKFINRESDMNISGLRNAKLSYHPHHMVEVFRVSRECILF